MNPCGPAVNNQRRKMIRRGATYGPALPEGAPEDGVNRGITAFIVCASLARQFEFAQNVWANDPNFYELGNERNPMIGAQDGTFDFAIPMRPIRKKIKGLPAFTTVKGGAYFFLSGIKVLASASKNLRHNRPCCTLASSRIVWIGLVVMGPCSAQATLYHRARGGDRRF
jgi:deferrochelatase/peroxidase EfeB